MTHEYESCIEVLVVLLDVIRIVRVRFLVVDGVEVASKIVGLEGWEESFKYISEATFTRRSVL